MARREPEITVDVDMYAPPQFRYYAHFGDLDLGTTCGTGNTPLAAIVDLLDQTED